MKKVMIISLGCPKNLVDSEIIGGQLIKKGYEMTMEKGEAQIAIINTCAFIEPAVSEAIDTIFEMNQLKEDGKLEKIVVAGCMVQRYREEILEKIPEIDVCFGIDYIKEVDQIIENKDRISKVCDSVDGDFLNLERSLSSNLKTAYVKIAEGCDNHCTYCTIPMIRGSYRSRAIEDVVKEANELADKGIKEIVLIAQDTTSYGHDRYQKKELARLAREISKIKGIEWIRFLYCYPEHITDELIDEMKNNPKILPYLDIPLQHASDFVLRSMGRKSTVDVYEELIYKLRNEIPHLTLRTTFITGFPGETQKDFESLLLFLKQNRFDHVGVFSYCQEEETPAAKMKNQITQEIKEERKEILLAAQEEIDTEKKTKRIGCVYDIIVEEVADDGIFYEGRSYNEAPEIDGVIYIVSSEPLKIGQIIKAKILHLHEHDLIGETI